MDKVLASWSRYRRDDLASLDKVEIRTPASSTIAFMSRVEMALRSHAV
jgi:hypothetical protein